MVAAVVVDVLLQISLARVDIRSLCMGFQMVPLLGQLEIEGQEARFGFEIRHIETTFAKTRLEKGDVHACL